MKIRRINLFGGPGIGKSTTAANLYSIFKYKFVNDGHPTKIELIQEYVKEWAWEGTKIRGFDQIYICASQLRREEIPLRSGVDLIITDSPLILQCIYSKKNNVPGYNELFGIAHTFDKEYPSINIVLDRGSRPYVNHGRYETHDKAIEMDKYIEDELRYHMIQYKKIPYHDIDAMVSYITINTNKDKS